jgi:hypothetical protein
MTTRSAPAAAPWGGFSFNGSRDVAFAAFAARTPPAPPHAPLPRGAALWRAVELSALGGAGVSPLTWPHVVPAPLLPHHPSALPPHALAPPVPAAALSPSHWPPQAGAHAAGYASGAPPAASHAHEQQPQFVARGAHPALLAQQQRLLAAYGHSAWGVTWHAPQAVVLSGRALAAPALAACAEQQSGAGAAQTAQRGANGGWATNGGSAA